MNPSPRVTLRDIAVAVGVHHTTVSLALRHDRRIPEETRLKVERAAKSLGYKPHPLLSALGAARRSHRPPSMENGTTLAFLVRADREEHIRDEHVAGAKAAAAEQGYTLETFTIGDAGLSPARLNTILLTRNIHGLIVAPLPEAHGHFELEWAKFCTVVIEYTFTEPAFDRVVHDNYGSMRMALEQCRRRGFRRVGVLLSVTGDERTEHLISAAYWREQKAKAAGHGFAPIEPLYLSRWNRQAFLDWLEASPPEVVITSSAFIDQVHGVSRRLPARRQFSAVNINMQSGTVFSGIDQDNAAIGATAVRMVIDKINRNDRGIPPIQQTVLTPGRWVEGRTLRSCADTVKRARA